jgi:TatD DNase family protein
MVIGVGDTLEPAEAAVGLAATYPRSITAAVGVHPHDAQALTEAMWTRLAELAARPEVSCVGEIGLDYHYDHSPRAQQREVFARFIGLARSLRKPIVVHTRSAPEDTLELLASEGARDVGGIIHCFSEDLPFAKKAVDMDFDVSFSGIVTFKNAKSVHETAKEIPLERVLVETDSPYLAPIPFRGKPCEPAFVVHTAQKIADLRGISLDVLATATVQNTERRLRRTFDPTATFGAHGQQGAS